MRRPSLLRAGWALRRHLAEKPEPYRVAARHTWTFIGRSLMEVGVVGARSVPFEIKELAGLRAASLVGCVW